MPQLRARAPKVEKSIKTESAIKKPAKKLGPAKKIVQSFEAQDKDVSTVIEYPTTQRQRNEYISTKTGKKITPFQYKVYDLVRQIPVGHVTSYKVLSDTLQSAPRAVGQALKLNPFCPLPIACHRIIATDKTIGGFSGGSGDHQLTANKKAKLQSEGCIFAENYIYKANADGSTEFFSDFTLV